jgi:gliding motility-associated protein GldC
MSNVVKKHSDIILRIGLSEENVPNSIEWKADENPESQNFQASKAFLLSLFDGETKDTLKIDLWTEDFQVAEMDSFMYQTLRGLVDTYQKATKNDKMASAFKQFVQFFGEETELLPKAQEPK